MFSLLINFLPNIVRAALVGGVLVNDTGDQVITQITSATDTGMLTAYMAVAAIQLLTLFLKRRNSAPSA